LKGKTRKRGKRGSTSKGKIRKKRNGKTPKSGRLEGKGKVAEKKGIKDGQETAKCGKRGTKATRHRERKEASTRGETEVH